MANKPPNSEQVLEIIRGCVRNKRGAQKELYQHFYSFAMSICMRYAKDRDDAVEMMNDAYMRVFQNIKRFDASYPFQSWFGRILVNSCVNHFKRNKKHYYHLEIEAAENESSYDDVSSGVSYEEVLDVIQKLPPSYRTIFNLHVIEGYKHEEISEMLGISVGASKSNLFKAKKKLREILQDLLKTEYEQAK